MLTYFIAALPTSCAFLRASAVFPVPRNASASEGLKASVPALTAGPTGGRALTYRIGGLGTAATFSGTIADQNAASPTAIVSRILWSEPV